MKAKPAAQRRRVLTRYSAQDRERLIKEQAQSGLTQKTYCAQQGVNLGTFHGWRKKREARVRRPVFAEVQVSSPTAAAVEVLLPNGARVGIRHQGQRDELVALIRGVAGC